MSQLKIKDGNNWINIPAGGIGVPSGGTAGQVLTKSSSTDYATEWATQQVIASEDFDVTTGSSAYSNYYYYDIATIPDNIISVVINFSQDNRFAYAQELSTGNDTALRIWTSIANTRVKGKIYYLA